MSLIVEPAELERLHAHAREGYPHEVVGILAGREGRVTRVQPLVNERADSPRNRYEVGGLILMRAEQALEAEGLAILGYYHSHPDHPAQYSEYDRDHALPNLSYLIVSVVRGDVADTLSWRLRDDRSAMDAEPIEIPEQPPMATIRIPTPLRPFTGGQSSVEVAGATVEEALDALTQQHEGLAKHLRDDSGKLRSFVNVYLGDEDIRFLDGPATALPSDAELTIVPSIAGGSDLPELSHEEIARYSRHLILDEVGMEGQRRLKGGSVLCVGTGGLGSPLLMYLAAAGVGRIGIVDFDVVDQSNLQRQVIHGTSKVGVRKVISAAERIADINPNVQVDVYEEALTSENALRICEPYDVIVDGTDNFPTRYLVNDACVILGKPNVYGSIFKFEGQASVFNYQGGPNYRDLYPEPPPPGLVPSCAEGGVLGILPGIVGLIQATETVKILLGQGTTLSGRLLLYDALGMKFRELKLRKDPAAKPITELIDYQQFCGIPGVDAEPVGEPFQRITVKDFAERRSTGWSPFVLDVRKPHEVEIARLPFMDRQQPHERVAEIADELPRDRDIVVSCKSGGRSAKAAATLAELGFDRLYNLEGGITAWAQQIDTSIPTY